jgi:hypothetical protein
MHSKSFFKIENNFCPVSFAALLDGVVRKGSGIFSQGIRCCNGVIAYICF